MADSPEITNEAVERTYRRGRGLKRFISARAYGRSPAADEMEAYKEETRKRARHEAAVAGAYRKTKRRRRRGRRG